MKHALICLGLALSALPAQAEEIIFKCYFDWVCDPNRKCSDASLDVRFRVDVDTNSVSRIGGDQLSETEVLLGDRALTVLEKPISGGVAATTIMIGNGNAVRAENLITGRDLTPMQYLGNCQTS